MGNEVESLIGPTDIILFPFGADVGDWHPYSSDNDRFNYLHSLGFRYFCNVDSTQYWVQFGKDYLRQGRGIWTDTGCGRTLRPETIPPSENWMTCFKQRMYSHRSVRLRYNGIKAYLKKPAGHMKIMCPAAFVCLFYAPLCF